MKLMEFLSQGNKSTDASLDDHQPLDQSSVLVSENFTLASYNFSDACFSIDIAKSISPVEGKANEAKGRDLKRELSLAPSTGIGSSHVWKHVGGQENKNDRDTNNKRMKLKDETSEIIENVRILILLVFLRVMHVFY